MAIKIGSAAPAFKLKNQDEKPVSLADYKGKKVIVYFYPAASTPGCTTQACDFRDNINSLKSAGYVVLGISPDEPEKLNFELLSDPDNKIQLKYGAYGEKSMYGKTYMGTIRSTFVVDKAGKLEHAFHNVKAKGHIEFLRKQLGL